MKKVIFCFLAISAFCASAMADEQELNIRCKRFGSSGEGRSDVACFIEDDDRVFEGSVKDENVLITGLELYSDAISVSNMKKGKIVNIKKMASINNVGQTMADLEKDTHKFCKRTGIKECKVSRMFFHIKTKIGEISDFYDKKMYENKFIKVPYKK